MAKNMNKTSNVISVIIPVYNVARYLPECLDSILNQTYEHLEILAVDDGSTDDSGRILDEYAQRDRRLRVFHQKNGGAASARNLALRHAEGEYLAFADSDDAVPPDAYARMVSVLEEYAADAVQGSHREWTPDGKTERILTRQMQELDGQAYMKLYTKDWTCGLLWDKLYRRALFDGVFFEEGHCIDDEFFTYQGMMNAGKVIRMPQCVYDYRTRGSSVTLSETTQGRIILDKLDYLEKRRKNVLARFPQLRQEYDYHYLTMLVLLAAEPAASLESIHRTKGMLKEYLREGRICKMEFSLIRKLLWLLLSGEDTILSKRVQHNLSDQQGKSFL